MAGDRLRDVAHVIRSKNAGPYQLTIDVLFYDAAAYDRVKNAGVLTAEVISRLYGVPLEGVQVVEYDPALAFKATFARPVASGDIPDTDVTGAQQAFPLFDIAIPE